MDRLLDQLKWPESGLLPAVAQAADSGQVLTLAWQNREALQQTLETGFVHYWSRSRQALWKKGETSGNVQRVVEVRTDCDYDAILLLVEPAGPACHTGKPACFYNRLTSEGVEEEATNPWPSGDILRRLAAVIADRRAATTSKSYVKSLLDDPKKAAAKVQEETEELIAAVNDEPVANVVSEAADAVFHTLVLAEVRGVDWSQIAAELQARFGVGGHQEKANRGNSKDDALGQT